MNRNQITNAWRIKLNDSNVFYVNKDEIVGLDIDDNAFIQGEMKGVSDNAINLQLGSSNISVKIQDIKDITVVNISPTKLTEET